MGPPPRSHAARLVGGPRSSGVGAAISVLEGAAPSSLHLAAGSTRTKLGEAFPDDIGEFPPGSLC